ncbi:MAG: hypothetical protein H7Y27_12315 [Gemmatimonadaceae bacterium]|nr:hypothetical protein [Chitinophagaceae bacterium]
MELNMSPEESLRLISDTIKKTRDHLAENSFLFMLWGWLITIASFSFFALAYFTDIRFYFLPFPILAASGAVVTTVYFKRKAFSTLTVLSAFLANLWMVLGIGFFAVVFIQLSQHQLPFVYTLFIASIGTVTSGLAMKYRPLIWGGLVLFSSAIICIYVPDTYKVLVHAGGFLCGYLIPGYMLKYSGK